VRTQCCGPSPSVAGEHRLTTHIRGYPPAVSGDWVSLLRRRFRRPSNHGPVPVLTMSERVPSSGLSSPVVSSPFHSHRPSSLRPDYPTVFSQKVVRNLDFYSRVRSLQAKEDGGVMHFRYLIFGWVSTEGVCRLRSRCQ
jgi:hypothetical protein